MPRPKKNLNNDFEPKTATRMQTKMHIKNDVMNPPLRRSNRLKQKKSLPVSKSSNKNVSSSQVTRSSRKRTATVNSQEEHREDTVKKLRTRKHSNRSKIDEINVEIPLKRTLRKRTVNQSSNNANLVGTSSTNTMGVRKRVHFVRADSKAQSTLPGAKTIRKRKAKSHNTILLHQNKSQTGSTIKNRGQTLPSTSLVREQSELEEHERLDTTTIVEATNNTDLEKVETSKNSAKSDETLHLLENEDNDFDDSYSDDSYDYGEYDSWDDCDDYWDDYDNYWDDYDYDNDSDDNEYWDDSYNNSSDFPDDDENNEETDHGRNNNLIMPLRFLPVYYPYQYYPYQYYPYHQYSYHQYSYQYYPYQQNMYYMFPGFNIF